MAPKFEWPWFGVIIPCLVIGSIGYGSHYFVFRHSFSATKQIVYQGLVSTLWLSYYIAIVKDPGSPPKNFQSPKGEWRRWCKKCENYKPERTHHCKTCKKCVLKMDHHCPWTYNCVGHGNLPHFLRFLSWILVGTAFVLVELGKRALQFYEDRNLPSYLIRKSELVAVIVFLPMDFFVLVTILILYVRCLINMVFKGMTQIEVWEMERIENQIRTGRIWTQIKKNYRTLYGRELPRLVSWSKHSRYNDADEEASEDEAEYNSDGYSEERFEGTTSEDAERGSGSGSDASGGESSSANVRDFTIDDLVFPYDLGMWRNTTDACGAPFTWVLPWGGPRTSGYQFIKSEYVEDDQLGLPWPPDGGHQENLQDAADELDSIPLEELSAEGRRRKLNRVRDPRNKLKRVEWMNDLGETLDDFGVDIEAEDTENDHLLAE